MKRREFIAGLLVAASLRQARAQQPAKVHRIAIATLAFPVAEITETSSFPGWRAFFHELRRFGYIEGRNLIVERYSPERPTVELAREVLRSKPDVIFSIGRQWTWLLKPLTALPIVGLFVDPVGFGLVASLAHPGGNITGVSSDAGPEFEAKRLELLKEAFPQASRVGVLATLLQERSRYSEQRKRRPKDWVFCYLPPAGRHPSGDRVSTYVRGDGTGTRRLSLCGYRTGKLGAPPIDCRADREESTAGNLPVPRVCRSRWSHGLLGRRSGAVYPCGGVHCSST